jgi:hypothetical protein
MPDSAAKSLDLKAMIDSRLTEVRMTRGLEKQALENNEDKEEEGNIRSKGIKIEPRGRKKRSLLKHGH